MGYQPFLISNFRTGLDTAVEPWLLPRDAFQVMKNAHLYRGVVEKVDGYDLYARMTYRAQSNMDSVTYPINGSNKTFVLTVGPLASTNVIISSTINTGATIQELFTMSSFNSGTNIGTLISNAGGVGTVNYSTNTISVTFFTAPAVLTPTGAVNSVRVFYDYYPGVSKPIMGIQQYYQITGDREILVFDTRRVGKVVPMLGGYPTPATGPNVIAELPHEYYQSNVETGDGITVTFSGTASVSPIVPGNFAFTQYTSTGEIVDGQTVVDNGANGLVYQGSNVVIGGVDYTTGAWSFTYTLAPPMGNYIDASYGIYGDLFTGDFTNFFSLTNYQNKAFFVNNVDAPMYYDGNRILYLNTNLSVAPVIAGSGVPAYDITSALHTVTYRDRLLLLAPTVEGTRQLNSISWSRAQDPLDWTNDESLGAPTSQSIKTFSIINTDLIVRFSNSEYVFRYIGDAFDPFRWDSTNVLWRCDSPYSAINYDSYFTSVGKTAIVASNGVNVQRADEIVPDITVNQRIDGQTPIIAIDQTSIGQCYGTRFDDFKEGWLCYKGFSETSTGSVQPSDSVLAFNYTDNTYATYTFPFSCLGYGVVFNEVVWGSNNTEWDAAEETWNTYQQSKDATVDLGGDQTGSIFQIGESNTLGVPTTNPPNPVLMDVITKNFNPFIEAGQMCLFGYLDLFVSANSETKLRVQFYKDDQLSTEFNTYFQETTLQFSATTSQSSLAQIKVWKRIYIGAVGKEFTMRIYQNIDDFTNNNTNQPVRIHAICLYCKPTGIIFS